MWPFLPNRMQPRRGFALRALTIHGLYLPVAAVSAPYRLRSGRGKRACELPDPRGLPSSSLSDLDVGPFVAPRLTRSPMFHRRPNSPKCPSCRAFRSLARRAATSTGTRPELPINQVCFAWPCPQRMNVCDTQLSGRNDERVATMPVRSVELPRPSCSIGLSQADGWAQSIRGPLGSVRPARQALAWAETATAAGQGKVCGESMFESTLNVCCLIRNFAKIPDRTDSSLRD